MIGFASLEDAQRVADAVQFVELYRPATRRQSRRQPAQYTPAIVFGKTDAAHNKSASGTVSVWDGTASASISDTGSDITAYNRFGNIGSGKWVCCVLLPFGWEIVAAEC